MEARSGGAHRPGATSENGRHAAPLRRGCRAHYPCSRRVATTWPFSSMTSKTSTSPSRPGQWLRWIELAGGIEFLQLFAHGLRPGFGRSGRTLGGRGRLAAGLPPSVPVRAGSAGRRRRCNGGGGAVRPGWGGGGERGLAACGNSPARRPAGEAGLIAPAPQITGNRF